MDTNMDIWLCSNNQRQNLAPLYKPLVVISSMISFVKTLTTKNIDYIWYQVNHKKMFLGTRIF